MHVLLRFCRGRRRGARADSPLARRAVSQNMGDVK